MSDKHNDDYKILSDNHNSFLENMLISRKEIEDAHKKADGLGGELKEEKKKKITIKNWYS